MKVLCICHRGDSRSVALAWLLKQRGHAAVAVGIETAGPELLELLYGWAERVIVLQESIRSKLPPDQRGRAEVFDVGPDTYFRGFSEALLGRLRGYLNAAAGRPILGEGKGG